MASSPSLSPLARRPLLSAGLCLIAGILLHPILPPAPVAWLTISAICLPIALLLARIPAVSTAALALAILSLGVAAAHLQRFHFPADHIATFTADDPKLAEIELRIDQPPRTLAGTPGPFARYAPDRQITAGVVTRIRTAAGWQSASGRVLLHLGQVDSRLAYDQTITALGRLSRPAPPANPGEFDWATYYRGQRVLASLSVERPQSIRVVAPPAWSPLHDLRQSARNLLDKGFGPDRSLDHALLRALLVGDPDPQLRDVQDDFQRTGTSHHLSISGLHVAVLGGFVYLLCRLARVTPRRSAVVMMAFVLLYGLIALPSPPVLRSIVLCQTFGLAMLLRRSVDGVQLLAFTLITLLIANPLDLYNPGFQLSFGTVLGLMILAGPFAGSMNRISEDDRVLMSFGIQPSRAGKVRRYLRAEGAKILAAAVVAWLVSAPLIIGHFDQLNPWAIPASILLAPIVFTAMIAGLLKVVLTLLLPWLAPAWAAAAAWPVAAMRSFVGWMATWPGSDVALPALPILVVLLFYALLALPLIPTARPALRRAFKSGAVAAGLMVLLLPLLLGFAPRHGPELRLTLLSVGAGQCCVVELPEGQTLLIDAGSSTIADVHRRILRPFLRHRGLTTIDAAMISHANLDHFSALPALADGPGVSRALLTPQFHLHAKRNPAARFALSALEAHRVRIESLSAGQTLALDDLTTLQVLWPPSDLPDHSATEVAKPRGGLADPNNTSQVLKLTCRGKSILFTGDVQSPAILTLLATHPAALRADILIAPHHGSAEPAATAALLDAVRPTLILASNDNTLTGKQRSFDALVAERQIPFQRTHTTGAITLTITKGGAIETKTFK
ncbi:MAG: ComEC/Rec2 family competence protein [Phycisphaerae bacterium]